MMQLLGVDTGGTFTDCVVIDTDTGNVTSAKADTVGADPTIGFMNAAASADVEWSSVGRATFGTTLGTNAIVERRLPTVALLCTEGFRDVLETRRIWREFVYDLHWERPAALVPRHWRHQVRERVDSGGAIIVAVDDQAVRRTIRKLRSQGARGYAVCFLFSFLNAGNERAVREIIAEEHPNATVSLSSDVLPEIREYERTSTTVVNALLHPIFEGFLPRLRSTLDQVGLRSELEIMKSNGGLMSLLLAIERPVETLASGPAAGVTACQRLASLCGVREAICFDMGGTTTDVALLRSGEPVMSMERDVEWNIPVRVPMLEIESIGAGGGSIGWVDKAGGIHVGPQSAGADPGPAAYGRGGTEPTVTDAALLLGFLNPHYFLGGARRLDESAARSAMAERLAPLFADDVLAAAAAVWRLAVASMSRLVREMTVNKGLDPRDFALISYGGAGGLFAAEVASELGIEEVICPFLASTFSALGGCLAQPEHDHVKSYLVPLKEVDVGRLSRIRQELTASITTRVSPSDQAIIEWRPALDLRYLGQAHELTIPWDGRAEGLLETANTFHQEHAEVFGFSRREELIELVSVRMRGRVRRETPFPTVREREPISLESSRLVAHPPSEGTIEVRVVRGVFEDDELHDGPLLVEQPDTTIWVPPGWKLRVDQVGAWRLTRGT